MTQVVPQSVSPGGQVDPHAVPLHVAVPPVGTGHAVHDVAPQLATEVLLTQVPLHRCMAPGQAHAPFWHVVPPAQAVAQPPQWLLSLCSLTQVVPHSVSPAVHVDPHAVPLHVAVPPVGTGHAVHDVVPQLATEALLTQVPLHGCMPTGQAHAPFWHVVPPAQAVAQPPQWLLSACSLTQVVPHSVSPAVHVDPHAVPLHVAVPPVGTGHAVHDVVPQLMTDVFGEHVPLHSCVPIGHTQVPSWHVVPPAHARPHAPQLSLLDCKSTHDPSHKVGADDGHPVAHASVEPPSLAPASGAGAQSGTSGGHTTPQPPQLAVAAKLVAHPVPASTQSA